MWRHRAAWAGFTAVRRAQGAEIDEIDIFALDCGASLPQRRPIAFADDELDALRAWQADLAKRQAPHWRELVPVTLDLPADWGDRPALLRALELTARHARADRGAGPWLGMPALLKALGVSRTPLPCLVAADKALRLARLDGIEAERLTAAGVVARALRPGKLVALVALSQRQPLLTPLGIARMLDLTLSGAGKLLARAAGEGLVVEISGRQAWRAYIAPDLAIAYGFRRRPVGRPTLPVALAPLDATLARFDAEMAAFAERFPELAVVGATHDSAPDDVYDQS